MCRLLVSFWQGWAWTSDKVRGERRRGFPSGLSAGVGASRFVVLQAEQLRTMAVRLPPESARAFESRPDDSSLSATASDRGLSLSSRCCPAEAQVTGHVVRRGDRRHDRPPSPDNVAVNSAAHRGVVTGEDSGEVQRDCSPVDGHPSTRNDSERCSR